MKNYQYSFRSNIIDICLLTCQGDKRNGQHDKDDGAIRRPPGGAGRNPHARTRGGEKEN